MKRFVVVVLCCLTLFASYAVLACNNRKDDEIYPVITPMLGGVSVVSEEGMKDPKFQEAVTEVLKKLDAANKCHNFQLVRVTHATEQVVAGIKYGMSLLVQPIMAETGVGMDATCQTTCAVEETTKELHFDVEVVEQSWRTPKHSVELLPRAGFASKFGLDGEMYLDCIATLPPPRLIGGWSSLTPEDMGETHFRDAVDASVNDLNEKADRCFRYKLDRVTEGQKQLVAGMNYKWIMKVHRIYDEGMPNCVGVCADECTGMDVYTGSAYVVPWESSTVKQFKVELAN